MPASRQNHTAARSIRIRLLLVGVALLVGFCLLAARSLQIQFFQREQWTELARRQVWKDLSFEPRRGEIYDCNGEELAVSIKMDSLAANPRAVKDPEATARSLAAVIEMPVAKLVAKLRQPRSFVWLKHCLPPRQVDAVRSLHLEGIHFVKESRRYYPNGELAGHVLGFVGREHRGLEGLELSQDALLRGRTGSHPGARDALGHTIYTHGLPEETPPHGRSLRLSLDKRIQYIAEKELQATVKAYQAQSGMVVVTEPDTGAILAMATVPSFNPNAFCSFEPSAWRNRAVTDAFEPGSTFKVFLLATGLEEEIVHLDDLFYCEQGNYRIMNHTIHDLRKFGWLSLAQILRFSSNIGASKVGEKLGAQRFYHALRSFGFGDRTGIRLPGETPGLIRSPEEWSAVDLAAASFGQSLSVSAIQLSMALGAVANDGLLMRPLLIKEVLDARGEVLGRYKPRVLRRVLSVPTATCMKTLLADVITQGGTGVRAALAHYRAAGKTGTAQKGKRKSIGYVDKCYTASFVGFVPVEKPRIVVVVVINEPQKGLYGGVVAAPAFRSIARQTLHCLNVVPQNDRKIATLGGNTTGTAELFPGLQVVTCAQTGRRPPGLMPDLSGLSLRMALDRLREFPGTLEIHGSGRVVGQSPEPGTNLSAVGCCRLSLAAD